MKIDRVEVFGVAVPLIGVGPLKTADDIVTRKLDLSSGSLALPGGPGLGVTLDDAKIAKYRFDKAQAAA